MSEIRVRPYVDATDHDAFWHVRAMTYNDGKPVDPEKREIKLAKPFVCERDGRIEAEYVVLDLTCSRQDAVLPCGGIAAVAVLPEKRVHGIGVEMMRQSLRLMKEEGKLMASLYAFRESFYRKVGYEACGKRLKLTVPNARYPKVRPELEVRLIRSADRAQIYGCYEEFCRRRSGLSQRDELLWNRTTEPDNPSVGIYVAGDPVEAYAVVDHKMNFWEGFEIDEIVWTTDRGYRSLLSTLVGLGINKTELSWYEPTDSPFLTRYLDQSVRVQAERAVMWRTLDVPGALRALRPYSEGEFRLRVIDDVLPENEGPWRVRFGPSGVEVDATSQADLILDTRQFTQALLGDPSAMDLARNGILTGPEEDIRALDRLLPASPVYCLDFF